MGQKVQNLASIFNPFKSQSFQNETMYLKNLQIAGDPSMSWCTLVHSPPRTSYSLGAPWKTSWSL